LQVFSIERLPVRPYPACVTPLYHDIRSEVPHHIVRKVRDVNYIVHFAADVSGIKSLTDPRLSVTTNVVGTFNMLELARKLVPDKFVQISTGEVVGSAPAPFFLGEDAPLRPSNPYAASKAAAEALVNAYRVSFQVPTMIVRSMNVFGPGQSTDRFVPMVIKKLLAGEKITCHVGPFGDVGSRCWLHVNRFSLALQHLLETGDVGEIYHLVGPERTNEEVIDTLAGALGVAALIEKVVPGNSHDLRYALKDTKLTDTHFEDVDDDLACTARSYR
jgi:dTDP-glucose 4,6-dehydratase